MLNAATTSMRFAASTLFDRPFSQQPFKRLLRAAVETQSESGLCDRRVPVSSLPPWDEETRRFFQAGRFHTQAVPGAREAVYYGGLLTRLRMDQADIASDNISDRR